MSGNTQAHRRSGKSESAFRTISEVAEELDVQQHVLRFWENRFRQVHPLKRGGGRRYYRPEDIELLRAIRKCLYDDGFTIKGAQKLLDEKGVDSFIKESQLSAHRVSDTPVLHAELAPVVAEMSESRRQIEGMQAEVRSAISELTDLQKMITAALS